MAVGDWATGTTAEIIEAHLTFDGATDNMPTQVQAWYRIVLPSGQTLSDIRTVSFTPTPTQIQNLASGLGDLFNQIKTQEGF